MGILRGKQRHGIEGLREFLYLQGRTLYDELRGIPVYRDHREALRPWDRRLPLVVDHEAQRRAQWTLKPPSTKWILFVLLVCIASVIAIGVVPAYANSENISLQWRDIAKPNAVYTKTNVLLSVWVIMHLTTGFALWFVYLSEGFAKHPLALFFMSVFLLLDCIWWDVAFSTHHFDWAVGVWVVMTIATLSAQVELVRDKIVIASLFLLPQLAVCITMLVYLISFSSSLGGTYRNQVIQKSSW
jgi:tryptophan-rich sensory protein